MNEVNELTNDIIGAAITVHRTLGPGLLESTYEACLLHELAERQRYAEHQKALPIVYKGLHLDCGYRIDLLVEREVIVELKAVTRIEPIHVAQLLSYLKLSGCHIGLLINFNVNQLTMASGASSMSSQKNNLCDLRVFRILRALCGE